MKQFFNIHIGTCVLQFVVSIILLALETQILSVHGYRAHKAYTNYA